MTDEKDIKGILERGLFRGEIKFDEPMSSHTSLKIGGPVDVMLIPEDPLSLKNALLAAGRENIHYFIIGGGTNLLVGDGKIEGIAISLRAFNNIDDTKETDDKKAVLYVGAGVPMGVLLNAVREKGYSGLEALAGIPGLFGGAVWMNAGSFGTEIKDVIKSVAVMNKEGDINILERDDVGFSYRSSGLPAGSVILGANIVLWKDSPEEVKRRTGGFLEKKKASQPLAAVSAGCVFRNPEGDYAGRLIEEAGCKGERLGKVEVSSLHANFFINRGGAGFRDFIGLMENVRLRVRERSGIELEPEIEIIGLE